MLRNTLLGLAAAATLALTASAASAGYYGYSYNTYYAPSYNYGHSYYQPTYVCKKVIVGYKTIYGYYGYQQVPVFKKVCDYVY
jgi:hypothetical protein